jgi:hypothetical protein
LSRNNFHCYSTGTGIDTVNNGTDFYVTATLLDPGRLQYATGNRTLNFNLATITNGAGERGRLKINTRPRCIHLLTTHLEITDTIPESGTPENPARQATGELI